MPLGILVISDDLARAVDPKRFREACVRWRVDIEKDAHLSFSLLPELMPPERAAAMLARRTRAALGGATVGATTVGAARPRRRAA